MLGLGLGISRIAVRRSASGGGGGPPASPSLDFSKAANSQYAPLIGA